MTVGVWVGNFDRSPLIGSSGVTGAGPLFHAVMLAAEARVAGRITPSDGAVLDPPATLVEATICGLSGMRAGDACPVRRRERLAPDAPQVAGAACTLASGERRRAGDDLAGALSRHGRTANGLRSPSASDGAEVRLAPACDARPPDEAHAIGPRRAPASTSRIRPTAPCS